MKKRNTIILIIILLASIIIRVYPIKAQLPNIYWHDEKNYIETALRFGSGDFMPYQLSHGGIFYIALFILYSLYYVIGFLIGIFTSPINFYISYIKDPSVIFIISRITVVASSILMLIFVYKSVYILFEDFTISAIAMLFASFSLLSVQMSSVALADMFSVMLLMAGFYTGLKGMSVNKKTLIYIASFFVGLSTAAKYNCFFGVFFIILFEIYSDKINVNIIKRIVFIGLFFVIGFVAGNPFILKDINMFYRDTMIVMGKGYIVDNPYKFPFSLWFHIRYHLRNAFGIPLEILFISGLFYGLFKDSKKFILISIFPITFYFLFSNSIGYCHHLLPVLPFAAIISSKVLVDMLKKFKITSSLYLLSIAFIIVYPTLNDSLKFISIIPKTDTRTIGKKWIETNVPLNSKILQEGCVSRDIIMNPQIMPNYDTIKRDMEYAILNKGSGKAYSIIYNNLKYIYGSKVYNIYKKENLLSYEEIKEISPNYIVLSDYCSIGRSELNDYLISPAEREKLIEDINKDYFEIFRINPTMENLRGNVSCCMINLDYNMLRSIKWRQLKNYINGPIVKIYKKSRLDNFK